jgi:hypothetical protein
MALTSEGGLEADKRDEKGPAVGLEAHERKKRKKGGTCDGLLASRRGQCICIYALSEDKYAKTN